jgi:branched-chain amino acid transport system substrate-binding protein
MGKIGFRVGAVLLAVALVTAACGDDDDDDSTGSATTAAGAGTTAGGPATTAAGGGAAGAVRGVTDTEVTVGGISEVKLYPGIEEGAKARFDRANAEGGVNGRTIKFVGVRDDGSDSARDLDLARELVGSDKVFAVAPVASAVFLPATSDYLGSESVPFYGYGFQPGFCGPEWGYGFNGCLIGTKFVNSSLVDAAVQASGLQPAQAKIAVQSADASFGESANGQIQVAAKAAGASVAYAEANYPPDQTASDNTPYVQAIIDSGANIAIVNLAFASTVAVVGGLKAAGFEGSIFNYIAYLPGALGSQPDLAAALDDTFTITQIVPAEGGSPAIEQITADLKASGDDSLPGLGQQVGWFSADLFLQQLEAAGRDLTPQSFQAAANNGFTYEAPEGGLGPVSFPEGHDAAAPCAAVVKVNGQNYEQILPMTCYESLPAS